MSVCAMCAKALGRSCCEVAEGEHLATLTLSDVRRIERHTRLPRARFSETERLSPTEAAAYEHRRPLLQGYFARGPSRLTLRRVDGACVFLSRQAGCELPEWVRPVLCRLYPLEPLSADGPVLVLPPRYGGLEEAREGGDGCLAVEQARSQRQLFQSLAQTSTSVKALTRQLVSEVAAHSRAVD